MEYKNPLDSLTQSEASIFHQHQMSPDATNLPALPLGMNDRSLQYIPEDSPGLEEVLYEEEEDDYDLEA